MEILATPKIEALLNRLQVLNNELAKNMIVLANQLHHLEEEEVIVLSYAKHNIVDRKKDKERLKKQWKVTLLD